MISKDETNEQGESPGENPSISSSITEQKMGLPIIKMKPPCKFSMYYKTTMAMETMEINDQETKSVKTQNCVKLLVSKIYQHAQKS